MISPGDSDVGAEEASRAEPSYRGLAVLMIVSSAAFIVAVTLIVLDWLSDPGGPLESYQDVQSMSHSGQWAALCLLGLAIIGGAVVALVIIRRARAGHSAG